MPISTACVKCHRPLLVKSSAAGKRVHCPRCSWVVEIPDESAGGAASVGAVPVRAKSRRSAAVPPRRSRADDEPMDVPTLKRTKYRNPRRSLLGLPIFSLRPGWWSTILSLIFLLMALYEYNRHAQQPQPVAQNAAPPAPVVAAPQVALQPLGRPLVAPAQAPIVDHPAIPPSNPLLQDPIASGLKLTPPKFPPQQLATVPDHPMLAPPVPAPPMTVPFGGPTVGKWNNPARAGVRPHGVVPGAMHGAAPNAHARVGIPAPQQLAHGPAPGIPRMGRYTRDNPPEIGDIVMVLGPGGRVVGKVKSVDVDKRQCKIKLIDARLFDFSGKIHESIKTRTVDFEDSRPHPRMLIDQLNAATPVEQAPATNPAGPPAGTNAVGPPAARHNSGL
jgi:hypothetical protein